MSTLSETNLMPEKKDKPIAFVILLVLSVASFIAASVTIWNHLQYQEKNFAKTKAELKGLTLKATADIDAIFREAKEKVDNIANDLTSGKILKSDISNQIQALVLQNPNYYGSAIAYRPYGYESKIRLFAPYYYRVGGGSDSLKFLNLEIKYDYTKPEYDWFDRPMNLGSSWGEPYWDPAGNAFMITYSSVFYESNSSTNQKSPLGVVTLDISMDYFKKIIEDLDLGASGFGALVSAKGIYLYHPVTEYVVTKKTISEVAKEKNDQNRLLMAEMAANGKGGFLDHISTTTKQKAWLVIEPVPITSWSLQNTFLKNDIKIDVDTYRHHQVLIIIWILAFLLFTLGCVYFANLGQKINSWVLISTGSLFILVAIGSIWSVALDYNPADKIKGVRVSDKATLQKKLTEYANRADSFHLEAPLFVPTGVYIDAIKFSGSSDVYLSGYVWQKYSNEFPEDLEKEFMISKATKVSIEKLNSSKLNGIETIQFRFEAEIRQKLTHKTYPLEEELIEFQIIHKELDHNIVLTPDLDAYKVRSASLLPGLDNAAFISGWNMINTYYELRKSDLNTNFGVTRSVGKDDFPVLFYNIEIQRNFVDAFISNLTPLIIVSVMLFFMLFLMEKIDTAKVFNICIAMFFVIVFSHIDIRSKISAQEIFYLEYFFFITYGLILYVALNAIGWLLQTESWYYHYKSNIYTLLYWPILLGFTFGVTVFTFY